MLTQFVSVSDVEKRALEILPKSIKDFYISGSDEELTRDRNISAYKK